MRFVAFIFGTTFLLPVLSVIDALKLSRPHIHISRLAQYSTPRLFFLCGWSCICLIARLQLHVSLVAMLDLVRKQTEGIKSCFYFEVLSSKCTQAIFCLFYQLKLECFFIPLAQTLNYFLFDCGIVFLAVVNCHCTYRHLDFCLFKHHPGPIIEVVPTCCASCSVLQLSGFNLD